MTEKSIFWPTTGVGDGNATGYSADDLLWMNRMLWTNDPTTQGPVLGYMNGLEVTNPAGVVLRVATGGALVYGFLYGNNSTRDLSLVQPIINTTGWRLVLRAEWTDQTVRAVLLQSADGVVAIPAVTQTPGVRWEISLATGTITTAPPTIAITDVRAYPKLGGEVDHTHIVNRTRKFLVEATSGYNSTLGAHIDKLGATGFIFPDNNICFVLGAFTVPEDFADTMIVRVVVSGSPGTVYAQNDVYYGAAGESWAATTDQFPYAGEPVPLIQRYYEICELVLSDPNPGDIVTLKAYRDAIDVTDNIAANMLYLGWIVEYTADM